MHSSKNPLSVQFHPLDLCTEYRAIFQAENRFFTINNIAENSIRRVWRF